MQIDCTRYGNRIMKAQKYKHSAQWTHIYAHAQLCNDIGRKHMQVGSSYNIMFSRIYHTFLYTAWFLGFLMVL